MARISAMATALDVMDAPWVWGSADCCTAACDVFQRLHGIDPMRSLRGRYSTRNEARRIIASYGGFLRMGEALAFESSLLDGCGLAGEIGIVRIDGGDYALAICIGGTWAAKSLNGMTTVSEAVRFWRAA